MSSIEEKYKALQQRLSSLPELEADRFKKPQPAHLEQLIDELHNRYVNECSDNEKKIQQMIKLAGNLESQVQQHRQNIEMKEQIKRRVLMKVRRNAQKAVEKMMKERKETEKRASSMLEACLIELAAMKTRSHSSCKNSIQDFMKLEGALDMIEAEIRATDASTKITSKEISAQFSKKIEKIISAVAEDNRERIQEQNKLTEKLNAVYQKIHQAILKYQQQREESESNFLDVLKKLVEQLKKMVLDE